MFQADPACTIGQCFGQNYNPSYHAGGLKGHTGIDEACGYGTRIKALASGIVISEFPVENPASDGYTAVFTLCRTPLETFELSYGHVSKILSKIGDYVIAGVTEVAEEGNHGTVYAGNIQITPAMQRAGDRRGSHRHYQKRPTVAVGKVIAGEKILQTVQGTYRDDDGNYHWVPMYDNGFNGCVDFTAPLFNLDMGYGDDHYYVLLLQRALVLEGFGSFQPNGHFGPATRTAVKAYQAAHNIRTTGSVGPLTRTALNAKYKQLS